MRRYLSAATALVAALALAACGSSEGSSSSEGDLTVAFPVPLTSGNKTAADQMVNIAKLQVKRINEAGGAGGRQLKLKIYDDKLTADESAKIAQRAITVDKAGVIVGGFTSIEGLAIREVTERRKVVYIATSTVSPQLTDGAKYTFRSAHVDKDAYPAQMAELFAKLGFKKPVVIHDDGPTGSTLAGPITAALEAKGLTAGDPVEFTLASTDVSSAVAAVKKQSPDSIVLIGSSGADAGLVVKTLAEQGVSVPLLGFGSMISTEALNIGGQAYKATDVYTLANMAPSKPQFQEMVKAYAEEYGGDPAELSRTMVEQAGQTWDGFEQLKRALDATDGDTDGDELAEALHSLEPFEGAAGKSGGLISYDGRQDAYELSLVAFKLDGTAPVEAG